MVYKLWRSSIESCLTLFILRAEMKNPLHGLIRKKFIYGRDIERTTMRLDIKKILFDLTVMSCVKSRGRFMIELLFPFKSSNTIRNRNYFYFNCNYWLSFLDN